MKVSATIIFTIKLIFFDHGLRQSIYTFWLFSWGCLAKILDKSCSKCDLVSDGVVIFIHYKIINLDSITNKNKKHNEKWPYIPDHPYRIKIIGGFGSGETNALINLINKQNDIDKIYFYARDLNKAKYEFLIKNCEDAEIKHLNDPNAFIDCSDTMEDVYEKY